MAARAREGFCRPHSVSPTVEIRQGARRCSWGTSSSVYNSTRQCPPAHRPVGVTGLRVSRRSVRSSTTAAPGSNPSKVSGATAWAGSRCAPQEVGQDLAGRPRRRGASAVSARFQLGEAVAATSALLDFGPALIASCSVAMPPVTGATWEPSTGARTSVCCARVSGTFCLRNADGDGPDHHGCHLRRRTAALDAHTPPQGLLIRCESCGFEATA